LKLSLYWIFNKLGHMIPLWKGKNPIYFGVIRSKVKVIVTINIIFDNNNSVIMLPTKNYVDQPKTKSAIVLTKIG
jgi:hypothetical protein